MFVPFRHRLVSVSSKVTYMSSPQMNAAQRQYHSSHQLSDLDLYNQNGYSRRAEKAGCDGLSQVFVYPMDTPKCSPHPLNPLTTLQQEEVFGSAGCALRHLRIPTGLRDALYQVYEQLKSPDQSFPPPSEVPLKDVGVEFIGCRSGVDGKAIEPDIPEHEKLKALENECGNEITILYIHGVGLQSLYRLFKQRRGGLNGRWNVLGTWALMLYRRAKMLIG